MSWIANGTSSLSLAFVVAHSMDHFPSGGDSPHGLLFRLPLKPKLDDSFGGGKRMHLACHE